MKRYRYNYQTLIRFSSPVTWHFFLLRCMPCENTFQKTEQQQLYLQPEKHPVYGTDGFGNPIQYGEYLNAHDSFVFVSSGIASLTSYRIPEPAANGLFRTASALTAPSDEIRALGDSVSRSGTVLTQAMALSQAVYNQMVYTPGSTGIDTTARQALAQRQGVCQDYAHILTALCRVRGIAARYVNGFIPGTGATHAWVEVYDNGYWYGIDPTHNQLIEYGYIKIAHGRDAADCPVNRGCFRGPACQHTEVRVIVEEL